MKVTCLYSCILSLLLGIRTTESLQPLVESSHGQTHRASTCLHAANEPIAKSIISRRTVNNFFVSVAASSLILSPRISQAEEETKQPEALSVEPRTVLQGTVSLASGVPFPPESSSSSSAIYLTCRPDKPDNVPAAILSGSRGKAPPVLAARIENPTFPLDFALVSPRDLTMEGASSINAGDGKPSLDIENLWWTKEDLIVSARWDSDGVAATRSPDDLVGRTIWKNGDAKVQLELGGRGAFGKYVTGSKK